MIRREVHPGDILTYEVPLSIETAWVSEKRTVTVEIYVEKIEDGKAVLIWGSPAVANG